MNIMAALEYLEEEEMETQRELRIERKYLRDKCNPFDLNDQNFRRNFRLNKEAFKYLLDLLSEKLKIPNKSDGLDPIHRLCAVLTFFSSGSYQHFTGKDSDVSMAQSTVSRVLKSSLDIFEENICKDWIKLDMSEEEKRTAKIDFYSKARFPGVIMCIDGTHVKLRKPKEAHHLFYNRKGYFSLNVMLLCDNKMQIRCVDSRYPGCNHDSHIWNLSDAKQFFQQRYGEGERNSFILGDGGYPLESWLITPFRSASEGSVERIFNKKLSVTRNIIERTIGLLKSRFRCLIRELYYSPRKVSQIVNVACGLHNICLFYRVENDVESNELEATLELDEETQNIDVSNINEEAEIIRNRILNSFI